MMSIVITFFAIPIGIWLLINERRSEAAYDAIFTDFFELVKADKVLSKQAKLSRLRAMLEKNQYDILVYTEDTVEAQKKLFSVGLLSIGTGVLYIGAAVYILYYFKFQKPHKVKFQL